jgi:hypothetical protein
MTEPSNELLRILAARRAGPCVSIYLPAGAGDRSELIRLKNLLAEAEERLLGAGVRPGPAHELLGPARALAAEGALGRGRAEGFALFLAPGAFHVVELPARPAEALRVEDAFVLGPLTGEPLEASRFYVLALSQNEVRLIRAGRAEAEEVPLGATPRSLEAFLRFGENPQRQLQAHSGGRAGGARAAIYHGAAPEESAKHDLLRFFHGVDRGVHRALRGERAPLVLACVDYCAPIYREASGGAELVAGHVSGNPDGLRPEELRDLALPHVQPFFARKREDALARYRRHAGSSRTSSDVQDIVAAATEGRVDALFLALGEARWGPPPAASGATEVREERRPGDVDLVELAAARTIANSGAAYGLDRRAMPADAPLAAIFRY